MNIAMGVAERQQYLHFQETPIIFRDMKPTNILLDKDIEPKISDFGISRAGQEGDKSYINPEYYSSKCVNVEYDFYSFGVVLLELISGRKARDIGVSVKKNFLILTCFLCLCFGFVF
ncbi:Serine/threonine-protein kinase PBL13 [Linum perenne]